MSTEKNQKAIATLELDAKTAALFGLRKKSKNNQQVSVTKKEVYLANPKPSTVGWFAPPPPPEED